MSRVEDYIRQHTKNCSNISKGYRSKGVSIPSYCTPWLTPNSAREVAKIAREEVIEKIITFLRHDHRMFIFDGIDLQNLIDDLCREVE